MILFWKPYLSRTFAKGRDDSMTMRTKMKYLRVFSSIIYKTKKNAESERIISKEKHFSLCHKKETDKHLMS